MVLVFSCPSNFNPFIKNMLVRHVGLWQQKRWFHRAVNNCPLYGNWWTLSWSIIIYFLIIMPFLYHLVNKLLKKVNFMYYNKLFPMLILSLCKRNDQIPQKKLLQIIWALDLLRIEWKAVQFVVVYDHNL